MSRWVNENDGKGFEFSAKKTPAAFTLIELLVVISVISVLLAILFPALSAVNKKVRSLRNMVNQRNITTCLNTFANDNSDRYPLSIATAGDDQYPTWADPRLIVSYPDNYEPRMSAGGYRSLSGYMSSYIQDPDIIHCPCSPSKLPYLNELWEQGDNWNNPDTPMALEPMTGSYCFWWSYRGVLTDKRKVFNGPTRSSGRIGQSLILVSDYFGADSWRNEGKYGSCESFVKSSVSVSRPHQTDFWVGGSIDDEPPKIRLHAAFIDGHCETYDSSDVIKLDVSKNWECTEIFPSEIGKGKFYLPVNAGP